MRSLFWRGNLLWLLLVVSLAFNVGFGTTFGVRTYQRGCVGMPLGDAGCLQGLDDKLNLTAEQRAHLTASRAALLERVAQTRHELVAERDVLAGLLAQPVPDRERIDTQLDRIAALQRLAQECVIEHLLAEKDLLLPEQRRLFDEFVLRCVCPPGRCCPGSTEGSCEAPPPCGGPQPPPCAGGERP
jgi:Spy/CpxP family protein refolding chaperone